MLKDENFLGDIAHSTSLSQGLTYLESGDTDAVLLDLGLPDSQGLDTFEKMHAAANHVPIIILTGFKDDTIGLEAVRRGAQDYLTKGKLEGALLIKALTYAIERKKLDEAVKRQADLIDLSPDAIIIKKPDDTITYWSLGAEKLYGYTKTQAIGQKAHALFNTKTIQSFESIDAHLKEKGKWSGELIHHTKLGREISIQSYLQAKFNENREIIEIFESNVDITERKNAERLAAIGATAGMVGHDIRNPLQTIAGEIYLAECVLKDLPDNEFKKSMKDSLNNIEEQMNYINKIVSDLQDYAKPLKPKIEEVNLNDIVQNILSSINASQSDQTKNIQIEISVNQEARNLRADKTYLQRILQNLINNAIQAMPNGGKLTVAASHQNGKAVISVEDTGEGIPMELRSKLFTPLVTMKSKGQGFGLAVVRRLTEALGGTITFESEVGKGTKFIVTLPN
jgi:two-component system, cell cycle sensor histidine kinase and response regulator CckA